MSQSTINNLLAKGGVTALGSKILDEADIRLDLLRWDSHLLDGVEVDQPNLLTGASGVEVGGEGDLVNR